MKKREQNLEDYLANMSKTGYDVVNDWLQSQGIIGYTDDIIEVVLTAFNKED